MNRFCACLIFMFFSYAIYAQTPLWERISGPSSDNISDLITLPNGNILSASDYDGLFLSSDNGLSWKNVNDDHVSSLCYANGTAFASTGYCLLGSKDNGLTWDTLNNSHSFKFIISDSRGALYAADQSESGGLYRSENGGKDWQNLYIYLFIRGMAILPNDDIFFVASPPFNSNYSTALLKYTVGYNTTVVTIPGLPENPEFNYITSSPDGRIFVCLKSMILFSDPSGNNWTQVSISGKANRVNKLYFAKNNAVYAATDNGILKSSDGGRTWQLLNTGLQNISFSSFTAAGNGSLLCGSILDSSGGTGLLLSQDNGINWYQIGIRHIQEVRYTAFDKDNNIYASTPREAFKFSQGSPGWKFLFHSPVADYIEDNQIAFSPSGNVFITGSTLRMSRDNGNSFEEITLPIGARTGPVCFKNENLVFVGSPLGVFRSDRSGENNSWQLSRMNVRNVYSLLTDPSGNILAATSQGIWKSTDNGESWTLLFDPGYPVYALARINQNLFAGVYGTGLYRSADDGQTWQIKAAGDPLYPDFSFIVADSFGNIAFSASDDVFISRDLGETYYSLNAWNYNFGWGINSLSVDNDGYIYASTRYGIYKSKSTLKDFPKIKIPVVYTLEQNYPNPFGPETGTSIVFTLTKASDLKIKVYDILGRTVATLTEGIHYAGMYRLSFNGEGLPSGIYFYRLEAEGFTVTKKLILMK